MFTDVEFTTTDVNHPKILGKGNFTVGGVLKVNFTLFDGRNGPFASLPGKYGTKENEEGKKPWFSDIWPLNREISDELNTTVLEAYKALDLTPAPEPEPEPEPEPAADDDIPF
jgi:DNA-binding cell septation regulator SpoVG